MVKRKAPEAPHEEHADETWLIPYSDLLTLLLALFIVLFASSTLDKDKMEKIEYALAAAFNSLSGDSTRGSVKHFLEEIKDLKLGDNVGLGSNEKGGFIELASVLLFEENSNVIKEENAETLAKIAQLLNSQKYQRYKVIVRAHTDSQPKEVNNWDLSAARASAIVNRFIKLGVDKNRFEAIGMADIAPKVPNLDIYGKAIPQNCRINNRVEIDIEI